MGFSKTAVPTKGLIAEGDQAKDRPWADEKHPSDCRHNPAESYQNHGILGINIFLFIYLNIIFLKIAAVGGYLFISQKLYYLEVIQMKLINSIFTGTATAIVTPLTQAGVDYENFEKFINWQISMGIDALVICGTTGESSTLSDEEHREVLEFAVKVVANRVPLIAGTGSNDTAYAIDLTVHACDIGYDAMLLVTPYYNKATQKGLIASFAAIADRSTKPCILYNVPSRTGVNIEPSTYLALADHPRINAIKEANGNISKIVETMALVGDKLDLYSGNDDQITPLLSLGGKGVISVLSNVLPRETREICNKYFSGDIRGSAALQYKYLPFINDLFCEVNPIPVKAAVAAMGFCDNYLRLPLTPMEDSHKAIMLAKMRSFGII